MNPIDKVITTIKVQKGTQKILKQLKRTKFESYDDVIRRLHK